MASLNKSQSLGYQVNLLARLLERALRDRISRYGVVPGQFPILLSLFEEEGLTQAQLAKRVQIEQPTVANTLQRMEREGLISRVPDPADRRKARIHPTDRARAIEGELVAAAHEVNAHATHGMTAADADNLLNAIGTAIANLRAGD